MHAIATVLDRAVNGQAGVVSVTGVRGAGKTRLVDRAVRAAQARQMSTMVVRGATAPAPTPWQGIHDLVRPLGAQVATLAPVHGDTLRRLAQAQAHDLAPGAVRLAVLELVGGVSATGPVCLVVDDLDLLDPESADTVLFVAQRLDHQRVATVVSARRAIDVGRSVGIVLDPLPDEHVTEVLARRGLAAGPARACARAARGLPGMAIALADGLTRAQRAGHERLPAMIRPARSLVEHQHVVLESLGERLQRALVVVAADELGQVAAVRRALRLLGEDDAALEDAEAEGLIEIDGPQVRFTDPWWRPAAYYLVAPASRRAAHRALAESYDAPEHAVARAWQLAAAAVGPSDRVAEALGLVAADAARRVSTAAAIDTYRTALEFGETGPVRERLLLAALAAAIDGLDPTAVRELVARVEPSSPEAMVAVAEAHDLLGTSGRPLAEHVLDGDGPWATRRRTRLALLHDARGGSLTPSVRPEHTGVHLAHSLVAEALQHRHAGRLGAARDAVARLDGLLGPACTELVAVAQVLHADLDLLAGRLGDAQARLRSLGRPADSWTRHAADWVRARVSGAETPTASPWTARAGVDAATDRLAAVRSAIARGCRARDAEHLAHVVRHASSLGLVVEAAEAELARLEAVAAAGGAVPEADLDALGNQLWTLGIHGWDARLAVLDERTGRSGDADLSRLSQAERRVAEAVGAGMTNREAAAALFLSVKTVDFHLQQIYRKLGVRSRTELAVLIVGDDRRTKRFAS
jgi:DNA-binding CsgD family transcriptional regulator